MSRKSNLDRSTPRRHAGEGVLRHPDGSIDFDAYRQRALDTRRAAIAASMRGALSLIAGALAGKPVPAAKHYAAKHHAT
jgi:hypothetical protein